MKTLANLSDLYVHYAYCDDVLIRERLMLEAFAASISDGTRGALHDATNVMPFANLEDGQRRRKAHGIKGARAPRVRDVRRHQTAGVRAPTAEPIEAPLSGPTATPSTRGGSRWPSGAMARRRPSTSVAIADDAPPPRETRGGTRWGWYPALRRWGPP